MSEPVNILATADSRDPIGRMRVYQLAVELLEEAWSDAEELSRHPMTIKVSDQLYSAVGSIEARIADGYSRSSGKDRSRFFEYALSSVRESVAWYRAGRPILGIDVTTKRWGKLEEIRRLLLAIIPRERERNIKRRDN
jgi:four helix bundle protein